MNRRIAVSIIAVAALVLAPSAALAHRPATRAEKTAIMYHAHSAIHGVSDRDIDASRAYPLGCAVADIATVVKGSQWAAWSFNGPLFARRQCKRWASDGFVYLHKINGAWYVITEGSDGPTLGVPNRIANDLAQGLYVAEGFKASPAAVVRPQANIAAVRGCRVPASYRPINGGYALIGAVSVRDMTCSAGLRAISRGAPTTTGAIVSHGFHCYTLDRGVVNGLTLGATVTCVSGPRAFRFRWGT